MHKISSAKETFRNARTDTPKSEIRGKAEYRSPLVIAVGRASDLVQGGTGKHTDSYSGYYWNGEGD